MRLNLPIFDPLENVQRILIAGAGGGFDIYAGLPIYFALRQMGKTLHLANFSFTHFDLARGMIDTIVEIPSLLMGVRGPIRRDLLDYFPEGHLAHWFAQQDGRDVTVWMFNRPGVQPLHMAYQHLIEKFGIEALILVDGGVDSLMRGDEAGPGTLLEDSLTLAAAETLDLPLKILTCLGFGAEVEEAVSHHHALENMAALIKDGGFLGSCALTKQMPAFQQYEAACRFAWESGERQRHLSHISSRVIPAVQGEFDDYRMYEREKTPRFISPLMSLYWFFDADVVAARSLVVPMVRDSMVVEDATQAFIKWSLANRSKQRPRKTIPY